MAGSNHTKAQALRDMAAAAVAVFALCQPARADFQLCNRMSYVLETAIAIEDKGFTATRGWFRIDPGQCRNVLQGDIQAESIYLHARVHAVYGPSPLPQTGHADLCIAQNDFHLANARNCTRPGERLVRFTAVKPSMNEKMLTANFAEEAEYTNEQARDAGIQRLLVIAGYDANPIDGLRGDKTEAALKQFLQNNKLAVTAAGRSDFFDILIAAAQKPDGTGFTWCNETPHTVMAAIGIEDRGNITTRGWYRVAPGACVRPELAGRPARLYSFAEAVNTHGNVLKSAERQLSWGGDTVLCTRNIKFELFDQKDCAGKGLSFAGFAVIDLAGRADTTVRFK